MLTRSPVLADTKKVRLDFNIFSAFLMESLSTTRDPVRSDLFPTRDTLALGANCLVVSYHFDKTSIEF